MEITLQTERLILRPYTAADLYSTHAYASDADACRYMIFLPNETLEETRQFLVRAIAERQKEKPKIYEFAVTLNGKHIGGVSIYLSDDRTEAELGWTLHRDHWGHGYATEAARALVEFATTLPVKKLVAHCDARNTASVRVMEKIGLKLESRDGTRRYKDTQEDVPELIYSLSLSD